MTVHEETRHTTLFWQARCGEAHTSLAVHLRVRALAARASLTMPPLDLVQQEIAAEVSSGFSQPSLQLVQ